MKKRNPWIAICPGIKRQTLTSGKTMYQMLATLEPDSKMPAHQHPQEQIVHILSGRMKLIVDGTPHEMKTGDSFYLAANIPHGVETIEEDRKSTRLNSSHSQISYAVFCLKKKNINKEPYSSSAPATTLAKSTQNLRYLTNSRTNPISFMPTPHFLMHSKMRLVQDTDELTS